MSNQLKKTVDVYYKEGVIAQIGSGQYGVINCKGDELEDNLIIKVPEDMTPVMFKDITGTVTVNGYVELLAEDGTAAKRVYLNIQVPSEYMLQGTYDSGYEYKIGDIVVHRGEVFVKIGEGQTEPVNGDVWRLFGGAIQDEKEVDIITHGKIEFEPDEGYIAMRKLTARVSETPIFDGTINIVENVITFTIDSVEYHGKNGMDWVTWCGSKYNTAGFTCAGENSNVYDSTGAWYVTKPGSYVEGGNSIEANCTYILINEDTGLATISGSYIIDQQKAYDALQALTSTKTFEVDFGAGGVPDGGDEMNFTSITFDVTNKYIKYGNIVAFVSADYMNGGDGFKDYTAHGGTGNGARINFADGTEVNREFKELFLSIADAI